MTYRKWLASIPQAPTARDYANLIRPFCKPGKDALRDAEEYMQARKTVAKFENVMRIALAAKD